MRCMGRVTPCSYPSVASLKTSRLHVQEKSHSTVKERQQRSFICWDWGEDRKKVESGEGSAGDRVTSKTNATGGNGNRELPGLSPKESGQQGSGQGDAPPSGGPSRRGGRSEVQHDSSMDDLGEQVAVQGDLVKHYAGRHPLYPVPSAGSLQCPPKPSKPPCLWEEQNIFWEHGIGPTSH